MDIEEIAADARDGLGFPRDPSGQRVVGRPRAGAAVRALVRLVWVTGSMVLVCRVLLPSRLLSDVPAPKSTAGDRQRFTVAHELGHLKLHLARTVSDERACEKRGTSICRRLPIPAPKAAEHDIPEY